MQTPIDEMRERLQAKQDAERLEEARRKLTTIDMPPALLEIGIEPPPPPAPKPQLQTFSNLPPGVNTGQTLTESAPSDGAVNVNNLPS